ncbi:gas vesicle protein GvpP [Peribacillus saganii]|uniref:Gas vesicle protein GvpP n=1 Tax=Peribacillus saganii TaxID=2303992 RepID=A0A372LMS4_9BACI|nr:gas vesicle protein GvpP [Peribacillus saganii]
MNLAIVGGVVGAGIGLFANRETSKKVIRSLSESEFVKIAGQEFRKTAHEILAGQAQSSVKQLASGYLSKIEQSLLSPKNSGSNNSAGQDQPYEEIKEENKNLNERLQKIEKMLGDLVESK